MLLNNDVVAGAGLLAGKQVGRSVARLVGRSMVSLVSLAWPRSRGEFARASLAWMLLRAS